MAKYVAGILAGFLIWELLARDQRSGLPFDERLTDSGCLLGREVKDGTVGEWPAFGGAIDATP